MNKAERSGLAVTIAAFLDHPGRHRRRTTSPCVPGSSTGERRRRRGRGPFSATTPGSAGSVTGTRAVSIDAPPEKVWPWLVQIGQDRAGFYSYTWLENLTLADIHNTFEIRPEWQGRKAKDIVRSVKPGYMFGLLKDKDGIYRLEGLVRRPGPVDNAQELGALSPSSRPAPAARGSSSGAGASPCPASSAGSSASGSSTRPTSSWKRR